MALFVASILFTVLFYVFVVYTTYISCAILYKGIKHKLVIPTIKTVSFIIFCYTSIISDVILFSATMYVYIAAKNGLLSVLAVLSITYAVSRKEKEHGGE